MKRNKIKTLLHSLIALLVIFCSAIPATARNFADVVLSGYVKDKQNGESLIGVTVKSLGLSAGTSSNAYGFYSLSLKPGKYTIRVSYVGYKDIETTVDLVSNQTLDFALEPSGHEMKEVVISSAKTNRSTQSTQIGAVSLSPAIVKQVPGFLGEADVVRTIQLLPGVTTVGEGAAGFNVRGGGVDQNLVLLDEAPVYNGSHLVGFFSVFNPDVVKDLTLMKSEMPARYGGRLSSLLDVRMKEGNSKDFNFSGGLGTIAARGIAEGPIVKDKSSFIVAGRRSHIDMFTGLFNDEGMKDTRIYFYDLSTKLNYTFGKKDRLYLSAYSGRDISKFGRDFDMDWGNTTATLRWNHLFSSKLFSNTSLIFSDYDYTLGFEGDGAAGNFEWSADIVDYSLKSSWNWYLNPSNLIYFGGDLTRHKFSPGKAVSIGAHSAFNAITMPAKLANDIALYWDHEIKSGERLSFQYGLRYSGFQVVSSGTTTTYEYIGNNGTRKVGINPQVYSDGETIKWYHNLEPRAAVKFNTAPGSALKAGYSRTVQNLHYMSNTMASTPVDIWLPSSANIKPQLADQVSAGYFYSAGDNLWEASAEVYYRKLRNQADFINGAEILLNDDVEADMLFGSGRAYGSEFFVRKNSGRIHGWVSYTLARTERKVDGINNNEYYPAKYDKVHSLSAVGIYQWKPRTSLSFIYNFSTGTPVTLPESRFDFDGFPIQYNSMNSRNGDRVPSYKRLDLSATFTGRQVPGRKYQSEFVVSVYNVLSRKNPFSIYTRQNEENAAQTEAVRYAVIGGMVPALTWNFKF